MYAPENYIYIWLKWLFYNLFFALYYSQYILEIEVDGKTQLNFGDYFVNMVNEDGFEERLKVLTVTCK